MTRSGFGRRLAAAAIGGRYPLVLWAIVLVALVLRVYHATNHEFTVDDTANIRLADSIRLNPADPQLIFTSAGHPLLVAYMAHAGSIVFGPTLLGYRMPMVLLGALTCVVFFRLGREIGGKAVGLWAAALVAVDQFHVTGSGTVHCHDIPLIFFGSLAMLHLLRVERQASIGPFVWVGVWMGFAYLGKETALMLWPALWLFLLVSPERRGVLRDPRWYLAHAAFLVVIAPDVIWNLVNAGEGYLQESVGKASAAAGGHGKAVSFFFGEIVMWFRPDAYGGHNDYWCWPLRTMHWVAGALSVLAVVWSLRFRKQAGVLLLQCCFWTTMAIVTLIKGKTMWDPFWWAAMALTPAYVLSGLAITAAITRTRHSLWIVVPLMGWLLFWTVRTLLDVPFNVAACLR